MKKKSEYYVIDAEGTLVNQTPFATERKAVEAKRVYEENCSDVTLPLRIINGDQCRATCERCEVTYFGGDALERLAWHVKHGHVIGKLPCSRCGLPTTFDTTYGDLCYRCCRADNE